MKLDVMIGRKYSMFLIWSLLCATVRVIAKDNEFGKCRGSKTIHDVSSDLHESLHKCMSTSRKALVLSMMLLIPLIRVLSSYLPTSRLWEKCLDMLSRRSHVDAESCMSCALNLIDKILYEGQ